MANKRSKKKAQAAAAAPVRVVVATTQSAPRPARAGPRRARPRRRGNAGGMMSHGTMEAVCALTDPFCRASIGTRYPDDSALGTFPLRLDALYTISTDAAGLAAVTFSPYLPYGILPTTVVGTTATNAANWVETSSAHTTFMTNNITNYRIVNWGLEIKPICPTMTNSGYFVVMETIAGKSTGGTYQTPVVTGPNNVVSDFRTKAVHCVSRPSGPTAFQFGPANVSTTTSFNTGYQPDWSLFTVMISGATATQAQLMVRIVGNYEAEISNANVLGMAVRPPLSNKPLLQIADRVRSSLEPIAITSAEAFGARIKREASIWMRGMGTRAAVAAGNALFGPMGGATAGAAASMIMDVD